MWLRWDQAAVIAACLAIVGFAAKWARRRWLSGGGAVAREAALILALYALWQKMGELSVSGTNGAIGHALGIWHVEQRLHAGFELPLQRLVVPHPLVVQALNGYYAIVHVPALIAFLLWMFLRHRDQYGRWRNVGAVLTGVSLVIQLIPVAPPRLLPGLGFVDTAAAYHQSVYGPGGISVAPQLSAMPSVHVGWAVFIALAVIATSTSRWRWLVIAHPVLTVLAVTATANHWWLDGAASVGLLGLAWLAVWATSEAAVRVRALVWPPALVPSLIDD
jgi:hypothetical protein